ncbi:putative ATP-dependent carboligase, ATP-grasp superfamily [Dehalogenimonas formicexedens]|uniref:Putative ATP-dependent carboligase, ATP-grasp superfamily n=1 Tax=Dehalogenimonas formicexedens TaxID=1839801 RepID=A0A1P8F6R6_9CHLR|nr:PAC2 family protein [Dehalogenimonas formicexedens]APV44138.1 putative ATP-dependent carboligase, ATP-grasp superfamily [Dehalogenimonas formicexedens]
MTGLLKYAAAPQLVRPVLVAGWRGEAGNIGERVVSFINEALDLQPLAEIEPVGFFQLSGVEVSKDLARLPDCRFKYSETAHLITLLSDAPSFEVHQFLKNILDLASKFVVGHVVVVSGFPAMSSHNTPSQMLANFSTPLLKDWLSGGAVNTAIDYSSPPGQKPPISTYLTWEAKQRGIEAVSLWQPVPYYLAPFTDETGAQKVVSLLRDKLAIPVDLEPVSESAQRQREKIAAVRQSTPEIEKYLTMLESNLSLTEYEASALAAGVRQALI